MPIHARAASMLLATLSLTPAAAGRSQAPRQIESGGVTIHITATEQDALAKRVAQVVELVDRGLDRIGLQLPRGIHVTLHDRPSYVTTVKKFGVDFPRTGGVTTCAYSRTSDWIPQLHVLAEEPKIEQLNDQLAMFTAGGLGGLVGITRNKNGVPSVAENGLSGYAQHLYLCSALHNGGKELPMHAVPELQAIVLSIAGKAPRLTPSDLLGKTPTDAAAMDQARMFLDVLLRDAPDKVGKNVGKAVIGWAAAISRSPDPKQVEQMEQDLVKVFDIQGKAIRALKLGEKMAELGIEGERRKLPGSLLQAYYEVKLAGLIEACKTAKGGR